MKKPEDNRYLLISPSYPPPLVGGHKVWSYNMIENCPADFDILTSSLKKGCVEISSPRHNLIRKSIIFSGKSEDINPTLLDLFFSYSYMVLWLTKRRFSVKYDAVVVQAFVFANGLFFLLGKLLGIPVIGMGLAEEFSLAFKGRGAKNFIKRHWIRFTHKKAAGFIAVCDFCKDMLVSVGVKADTIYVVPINVSTNKIKQVSGRSAKGFNILSVGRLVERKGFHYLIDAVDRLKDALPEIRLTIVGDGPYRPALSEKVSAAGLDKYVSIKGLVSDEELAGLYVGSNIFVLANMMLSNGDTEGCPTVFAEASGCGLPVIGGKEGGVSTVIVDGKTGYIVDSRNVEELADSIEKVLTDPHLAEEMGQAGMEKVRQDHTPQVTGSRFYEAIQKILQRNKQ